MSTQSIGTFWQRWMAFLLKTNGEQLQVNAGVVSELPVRLVRNKPVVLQKGGFDRQVLKVREGIVWLTGTPAVGDVILRIGDRFVLDERWPFVVQAMEDAVIDLYRENKM
jgi:Protein of unknown function (DUF2917)